MACAPLLCCAHLLTLCARTFYVSVALIEYRACMHSLAPQTSACHTRIYDPLLAVLGISPLSRLRRLTSLLQYVHLFDV